MPIGNVSVFNFSWSAGNGNDAAVQREVLAFWSKWAPAQVLYWMSGS